MTVDQVMVEAQLLKTMLLEGDPEAPISVERAVITRLTTRLEELDSQHGVEVVESLRKALEECRLYAARNGSTEWGKEVLRLCADAGIAGAPIKTDENPS